MEIDDNYHNFCSMRNMFFGSTEKDSIFLVVHDTTQNVTSQEAFFGTLVDAVESGLSIWIFNGKPRLQGQNPPESQNASWNGYVYEELRCLSMR